jgi:hypothetical protein
VYFFNFERRTSNGRTFFFIVMYFCGRSTSTTVVSGLVSFNDIGEISAEGPLKSSSAVSAGLSSASLAKISYSTFAVKSYPAWFDVLQQTAEYSSMQL